MPLLNPMRLYELLDAKRNGLGLSWRKVAHACGMLKSTNAFTRLGSGDGAVQADTLIKLLAWLDVPWSAICDGVTTERDDLTWHQSQLVEYLSKVDVDPDLTAAIAQLVGVVAGGSGNGCP